MLCCICKQKEASVHLTQIVGDIDRPHSMQTVHLCKECATCKGVNEPAGFSMAALLQEVKQSSADTRNRA